ncbi:MAG: thiamine pyrophosphate-dependent enzyme [Fuerstiella sp.]|nr:thiamine pyrophosphate-dependent enzyme [Fuerstiella sp.]
MSTTGIHIFLDMLAEFGVDRIFGNPGSTELPLNDALVCDDRFRYILGLQEIPVMAMADGYSMASGNLSVVNVHVCPGLGNAMGMLYNAYREGTPILVTAGQQDRRLAFSEPILGGEMVAVARPWTKWSFEVNRIEDLPGAVQRAARIALTPPTGPVFLSLPVDLQMECAESLNVTPISIPNPLIRPPRQAVTSAAEMILTARNPLIIAGSRVTDRGAGEALVRLAETIGVAVVSEPGTTHGRSPFPSNHPLYGQGLPLWAPEIHQRLEGHDLIIVTGMDLFRLYVYFEPDLAVPEHLRVIQIDEDPLQLGRNFPVDVGIWGHTRVSLEELNGELESRMTDELRAIVRQRSNSLTRHHNHVRNRLQHEIDQQQDVRPMTPLCAMDSIARVLPDNVAIVEEAVTTTNTTIERLGALRNTTGYFGHRGWGLGWGLNVAIGTQMAWPDRPVVGIIGDGAALYGIQGLWSAAKYNVPVSFVICNNAQYHILKIGAQGMQLPSAGQRQFEGMDLVGPEIDFVSLAESFGVEARRITEPDQLSEQLTQAINTDRPVLLDVDVSRELGSRLNYGE